MARRVGGVLHPSLEVLLCPLHSSTLERALHRRRRPRAWLALALLAILAVARPAVGAALAGVPGVAPIPFAARKPTLPRPATSNTAARTAVGVTIAAMQRLVQGGPPPAPPGLQVTTSTSQQTAKLPCPAVPAAASHVQRAAAQATGGGARRAASVAEGFQLETGGRVKARVRSQTKQARQPARTSAS